MSKRRGGGGGCLPVIIAVVLVVVIGANGLGGIKEIVEKDGSPTALVEKFKSWVESVLLVDKDDTPAPVVLAEGELKVHFIDVGNADAILLMSGDNVMLIDAGDNGTESKVISYLKAQGVTKIDYLVATHAHADHIGGMAEVIDAFDVGAFLNSPVASDSWTYESMMSSLAANGLQEEVPAAGAYFDFDNCTVQVLGPITKDDENLNNDSIVIRLVHGNNSFLFTGDAEYEEEVDIRDKYDIVSTVLKVGHHGSYTSTSYVWLYQVNPKYAYIPCGVGNEYGHPHDEVTSRLEDAGVEYYRADINGTVVFTSDGTNLSVECEVT